MRFSMNQTEQNSPQALEPLLAGTLALMTFYADRPNMAAVQSIGRNLQALQQHPQLSVEMCVLCQRLATYWLTLGCEIARKDAHSACRFAMTSATTQ